MPPGTLERQPPPFFRQGTPALAKLVVLSALAVLLMVLDARFQVTPWVRHGIAVALYPLQWLAWQPVRGWQWLSRHTLDLQRARREADEARLALAQQADRAGLVEHLAQENRELRALLGLRERVWPQAIGAEILHALPDPYRPMVLIDRGAQHGVTVGAAVMDGWGVLGQVTRVLPWTSEVTLLAHPRLAVPVLNTRTGERHLAFGNGDLDEPALQLRFVPVSTETQPGDTLVTSGIDGVYPAGLPVGQVVRVEPQEDGLAQVLVRPSAHVRDALHVLVLQRRADGEGTR
ncbi:Cell shape-determining protein MreC [Tepidimonas alkaliphilus]|uniref:Cell shape-determining protein MreC n=1 Tax=Tepidimonas alkaliphilus TaxID=2588942 RepID=A0A554W518_9BURK|nr:rod shape-determining protein MreC [Tepidimonas alkaliphilus]TSE18671.1 Cell shape-determining protein MreC [Tepidimonas alkaliphilus]